MTLMRTNYKMTTLFISKIVVIKSCYWGFAYLSSVIDRNDNLFDEEDYLFRNKKHIKQHNILYRRAI